MRITGFEWKRYIDLAFNSEYVLECAYMSVYETDVLIDGVPFLTVESINDDAVVDIVGGTVELCGKQGNMLEFAEEMPLSEFVHKILNSNGHWRKHD